VRGPGWRSSWLYGLAFVVIARFIPPPSPSWSAERIDALFIDHAMSIRIGLVLSIIVVTSLFPYFTFISAQIGRIERSERRAAIPPMSASDWSPPSSFTTTRR
jgi:hypothetical protein